MRQTGEVEKDRSYHKGSLAETEIFCYEQLFSPELILCNYND
ncbi:hypothetical protein BTN49_1457 [Candidatus Enterovibrio escicola]|uniref:Mobile element protein n=1 Tax=Candidatus Enterovibrio escicola TaxID=1927127 RepID=A0A2A5T453_9GAMM|nr:hypothetical protein BTN49_1457 [Candidatus Enterovibrio escacola]